MFCAKLGWRLLRRQWTDVINNAEADDPDASLVVFYLPLIACDRNLFSPSCIRNLSSLVLSGMEHASTIRIQGRVQKSICEKITKASNM